MAPVGDGHRVGSDADRRRTLVGLLLAWGDAHLRELPWRDTRDPWAVLVAELMLQQTPVERVVPRYLAFLARFGTPSECAASDTAEVLRAWEGLGYNRRAVMLHRAARMIVDRHAGRVPEELPQLLDLPGIGPYTARAVLAFAFERDHGVVDTNAARFLARAVLGRRLAAAEAQATADELVPAGRAWLWNQAVLDLGATVCVKRRPHCGRCPIATVCSWATTGSGDADPAQGTAGATGRQARFEGSERQGRGRLLTALRRGPVPVDGLADAAGWADDPERARRAADRMAAEGLAEYRGGVLVLPEDTSGDDRWP